MRQDRNKDRERAIIPPALDEEDEPLEAFVRLRRDLRTAARQLTSAQARWLVDLYYQVQQFRIEANAQARASATANEPVQLVSWVGEVARRLEGSIKGALDAYTDNSVVGRWSKSIVGIGPIIAAGLLAHVEIAKCRTAGSLWRFAGLDPTQVWEKGQKRPWNARLKVLCFKIGESFVKHSSRDRAVYGQIWLERKALEEARNASGQFADQARAALESRNYRRDTVAKRAYEEGKLPPGQLHARAKRYAVKLFLAHWQHVAWESAFGEPPPKPYVIAILGHQDYIGPPNWPIREDRAKSFKESKPTE